MSRTGELRERVTLQSVSHASSTQSGIGVASFSTLATAWAKVSSTSGNEALRGSAVDSSVSYDVELRYRADLTPRMRVVWTPRGGSAVTLEVLAVLPQTPTVDRVTLRCGVAQ